MAKPKLKIEQMNMELMLEIRREFPQLMRFYYMANLDMDVNDFYQIMRGEPGKPELVQIIELGWANVSTILGKTDQQLVNIIKKSLRSENLDCNAVRHAAQLLAARLYK